jgi:hypothetical protein
LQLRAVNRIGSGFIKVAMVIFQQIFLHFSAGDFPFKFSVKKCPEIVFLLWRQGFGAAISVYKLPCVKGSPSV